MAAYVDFTFYNETYLGTAIPEATFTRIALRSAEILDRLTFGRAEDDEDNTTAIKNASCAIADVFYKIEQGGGDDGIKSEGIGQNAITYTEGSSKAKSAIDQYMEAARLYLENTPLLYRGFATDEYGSKAVV